MSSQNPEIDPILGEIRRSKDFDGLEGLGKLGDLSIDLLFPIPDPAAAADPLDRARRLLPGLSDLVARATVFAADELLELKNRAWLQDGEAPSTAEDFRGRMQLEALTFLNGGEVHLTYRVGDYFWGHGVIVHLDAEDRLTEARIA